MRPDEEHPLRLRLIDRLLQLPAEQLEAAERSLTALVTPPAPAPAPATGSRHWPHAPLHRISEQGTYLLTAATYQKAHFFRGAQRLGLLEETLLRIAAQGGWQLEAWAVFSNHYHFVGHSRAD